MGGISEPTPKGLDLILKILREVVDTTKRDLRLAEGLTEWNECLFATEICMTWPGVGRTQRGSTCREGTQHSANTLRFEEHCCESAWRGPAAVTTTTTPALRDSPPPTMPRHMCNESRRASQSLPVPEHAPDKAIPHSTGRGQPSSFMVSFEGQGKKAAPAVNSLRTLVLVVNG